MQQLLFDNINKFASLEALHIEYFLFPNIINATHATTQCNNYHLTKCTHVPRRPCLLLKCMQNDMSLVKIVDNVDSRYLRWCTFSFHFQLCAVF